MTTAATVTLPSARHIGALRKAAWKAGPGLGSAPRLAAIVLAILPFAPAVSAAAAKASDLGPPPAIETAGARAHRYRVWRATRERPEALLRRVAAETREQVEAYRAQAHGEDLNASPVIFHVKGAATALWDCAACPVMTVAPAGVYTIGSPADEPERGRREEPRRRILIPHALAVSRFKVTRGEYEAFVKATGRPIQGNCVSDRAHRGEWAPEAGATLRDPGFKQADNHPVVCVSWDDAQAYIAWLNGLTHGGYRLPTEAEWEFLARAGSTAAFPWGADPDAACAYANVADATALKIYPSWAGVACSDGALNTSPVGSYKPNAFGLYDVIGNVEEWLEDCVTASYVSLPAEGGPAVGGDCTRHFLRGGSWGAVRKDSRVAKRTQYPGSQVDDSVGIRVVRTIG